MPPKKAATPVSGRIIVNAPLDFTLKNLDPDHPYLRKRGFTRETIDHFELGYASRGLMQGRIAIPLRNEKGQLIGYAGRVVDDLLITDDIPKYRFPSPRDHDGNRYEFSQSMFLYNGNAVDVPTNDLILVRSLTSVWWLWQHGFKHVAALMGATCSPEQAALIVIWVLIGGRRSLFGAFVGAFLIFNTLSMTVSERVRELGLLRAAGATRGQLVWFVLAQAIALGVAGSLAGLAVGFLLGELMAADVRSIGSIPLSDSFAARMTVGLFAAIWPATSKAASRSSATGTTPACSISAAR